MKSLLLGVIGTGAIGAVGICDLCAPATASAAPLEVVAVVPDTSTVRLRIDGMTCGGCAISARIVLERLEGVEDAEVDYETKLAVVAYDGSRVTPEQMISALDETLNYTAVVVRPSQEQTSATTARGAQ